MSKITKAILTGGGRATRLRPITTNLNKHLIPLANKPMIFHAIEKAVEAGIKEIFINTNPEETELQKVVGDGSRWGINITYYVQEGGPQGIAHVVNCAKEFIGSDPFMFYLSDNIILASLRPLFEKFEKENLDCLIALSKVPDPERFGVPRFDENDKLVEVLEKPSNPPSDFAVTGIYLFGPDYFKAFATIDKSARGEYEIPSIFNYFLQNGYKMGHQEITGWWKDTGKADDLILANKLLMDTLLSVADNIKVGKGTHIGDGVKLNGPVMIGANCQLKNCTVGPYVSVGEGSTVKDITIQNSIIFDDTSVSSPPVINDAIIGPAASIIPQ
ncbi:MAG: glucose-1-phosphate thymidylyltransferase [Candidatus Magasanikbacteria bacterium]|nr:glucose-1-phosphate thymidylyltransferase [Candidatus Magasanikbacteria bacterium]